MSEIKVRISRRDSADKPSYIETFSVAYKPGMTVLDVLFAIQLNPVNEQGQAVAPVVWECNCQEEVCGACAMNICGQPKMACGTLVDEVVKNGGQLVLAPLAKFPVVRDLVVDKTAIYDTYKRLQIYLKPGQKPVRYKTKWKALYEYTRCMSCGICREACPNTGVKSQFSGGTGLSIVRAMCDTCDIDISSFTEKGGVAECSGHSLCNSHCPKRIDLPAAFSYVNKKIITDGIKKRLLKK